MMSFSPTNWKVVVAPAVHFYDQLGLWKPTWSNGILCLIGLLMYCLRRAECQMAFNLCLFGLYSKFIFGCRFPYLQLSVPRNIWILSIFWTSTNPAFKHYSSKTALVMVIVGNNCLYIWQGLIILNWFWVAFLGTFDWEDDGTAIHLVGLSWDCSWAILLIFSKSVLESDDGTIKSFPVASRNNCLALCPLSEWVMWGLEHI